MKEKTKLKLQKHVQYGRERLYPACPLSKAICLIIGGKTISDEAVGVLEKLGECEVEIESVARRPRKKGDIA